jgi:hypothetical protein
MNYSEIKRRIKFLRSRGYVKPFKGSLEYFKQTDLADYHHRMKISYFEITGEMNYDFEKMILRREEAAQHHFLDHIKREVNQVNIVKELNDYFGMEAKSVAEFIQDFDAEHSPRQQGHRLISFIEYLDRKYRRE